MGWPGCAITISTTRRTPSIPRRRARSLRRETRRAAQPKTVEREQMGGHHKECSDSIRMTEYLITTRKPATRDSRRIARRPAQVYGYPSVGNSKTRDVRREQSMRKLMLVSCSLFLLLNLS